MKLKTIFSLCVTALIISQTTLRADDVAEKGRAILEKNKAAVVTIQVVMKGKWESKGYNQAAQEMKLDLTGIVIDATGLTVTALSGTDPGQLYENYYASSGGESKPKWVSEITDLKILSPDGTEIPAEIILRDKDLDLAFLRPTKKPETAPTFIELANSSEVQVLDQLITLNRLGKVAQRVYAASIEHVDAVVTKPKKFYIPGSEATATRSGCPAFALDGKIVGFFVMRAAKGRSSGSASDNFASIIIPAEDVRKAALQAPAATDKPKEEKKDEKPADNTEKK